MVFRLRKSLPYVSHAVKQDKTNGRASLSVVLWMPCYNLTHLVGNQFVIHETTNGFRKTADIFTVSFIKKEIEASRFPQKWSNCSNSVKYYFNQLKLPTTKRIHLYT